MYKRPAVFASAALLVLTGCGATSGPPAATQPMAQQSLGFHQAKQGFYWNVAVHAPSLARAEPVATLHMGQDVCNDIGGGQWTRKSWNGYSRHFDMTPRQTVAIIKASVAFLCPDYAKLVGPAS